MADKSAEEIASAMWDELLHHTHAMTVTVRALRQAEKMGYKRGLVEAEKLCNEEAQKQNAAFLSLRHDAAKLRDEGKDFGIPYEGASIAGIKEDTAMRLRDAITNLLRDSER